MALEDILSRIKEETDREIDTIIGEAKVEKEKRLKEAQRVLEEEKEREIKKAKVSIENWKKAEIAKIKQEARKKIIQLKEGIIKECFNEVLERFKKIDGQSYRKIVEKWMKSAMAEIGNDIVIIAFRDEDREVAEKLGLEVKKGKEKVLGGFIAQSKDGDVIIDYRIESIMEREKNTLRAEIGNLLFGG